MTTSAAGKGQKKDEKVEKRRALGRGLESLLPGPPVVSRGLRVPGSELGPQGLKPQSSSAPSGTAEAVPFPVAPLQGSVGGDEVSGESGGGVGEKQVPRVARNDKTSLDGKAFLDDASVVSERIEGGAAGAAGQARAAVPTLPVPPSAVPTLVDSPGSAFPPLAKEAKGGAASFEEIEAGRTEPGLSLSKGVSVPQESTSGGSGGVGEKQIPHFVWNDNAFRDDKTFKREAWPEEPETIEIQAMAIPSNLVINLDISLIEKNPYQTRYLFDEEEMEELRDSIKEHGVVQPIVVRPGEEEGRYILVLGERRLRASKMAGKETIPAVIRRVSLQQAAEMTVLENVVREDLNPLEQAEAFRLLSKEFQLTQAQIADQIGVSREKVSNYMRLLRLPKKAMEYLLAERLNFSDCREILALDDPAQIEKLAEEVVTKHLKWDEIERRVSEIKGFLPSPGQAGTQKKGGGARWVDPNVRAAQMEMERTLGMRVRIRDRNGKGKIVIEYASVDDYERVVEKLRKK